MRRSLRLLGALAVVLVPGGAEAAPLEDLPHAASYRIEAYMDVYPDKADGGSQSLVDGDGPILWTRISGQTFAQLSESLRFNVAGYLVYSEPGLGEQGTLTFPGADKAHPRFGNVTALNFVWSGPELTVLTGKAQLNMGVSDLHAPTDRFDSYDYSNPLHVKRLGRWQVRADRQFGDDTASLVLLPFEEPNIGPSDRSRWVTGGDRTDPARIFNAVPGQYRNGGVEDMGILASYMATRDGYDVFLGTHYGPGAYPTIRWTGNSSDNLHVVWPSAASAFGGAVATVRNWRLYGEGLFQHTPAEKDEDVLRYTAGVSPRFPEWAAAVGMEEISATVEYSNEWVTRDHTTSSVLSSSYGVRPYRNTISSKASAKIDQHWTISATATQRIDTCEFTRGARIEYHFNDNLVVSAEGGVLGGGSGTPFGQLEKNDFVTVGFDYRF